MGSRSLNDDGVNARAEALNCGKARLEHRVSVLYVLLRCMMQSGSEHPLQCGSSTAAPAPHRVWGGILSRG